MSGADLDLIDLTDPHTFQRDDLHAMWRAFRARGPAHWHHPRGDVPGFWVLPRYADALAVYRDAEHFSSEGGTVLTTLLAGGDSAAGKMLEVTDGVRHREIKAVMQRSFSPRVISRTTERVRERTRQLIAEVAGAGAFDFAARVGEELPINTIADLMDLPTADRPMLLRCNKLALSSDTGTTTPLESIAARNEILLYFADLVAARRRDPGDDVVSALAHATVNGAPLREDEVVYNCYSLIIGGDESSRVAATGTVLALAGHRDQWQALLDGSVAVEAATEEALRWTTPAMHFGRRAATDVTVAGVDISAGDIVTLWNTSANFDETEFPEPELFRLGRRPNRHLALGHGPHFCLGAFLGRAELSALLGCLRELVGGIEVTGPPRRIYSNFLFGYSSLPVEFRAR
ncbi:cytochrome P450 [Amorphoplanes nipponensis]|uniref:Cytochrome P450 n=1 Tax=Actinoplanes nipponensis TaxID=135950 RepID=A0A919MNL1_9ACTN|nr:cytochrome P450 [Actinoplanes nipponensis]GIE51696.1 cytochrome P450 [Actinoplanes nipponensis]